jgi:hypothetical protein
MNKRSSRLISLGIALTMLLMPLALQAKTSVGAAPGLPLPVQEEPLESIFPE